MDLIAAWLLYPLALGALGLGLGLLVAAAAGWRLPGLLLLPVGFATLLAVARLATAADATAELTLPLLVVLAGGGLVAGRGLLRTLRPEPFAALAALGVFAVFAAPIVLSGSPTFAGYLSLPDTSHQLTLASLYPEHGPAWQQLAQGSTRVSLSQYVTGAYPVAPQAALGATAPLGTLDLAWLYQPFITCLMVVVFLSLASLVAPLLRDRWQAAAVAFVAAQSALVVGFALQGSIKELAALALFCVVAALTAAALRERRPARSLLPVGIAAAAAVGALGPAAVPYLALPALVVFVVWGRRIARERDRRELGWLAVGAVVMVALAAPVLASFQTAVEINTDTLDASQDLGNLAAPLGLEQALGIWFQGDYRYEPIADDARRQDVALGFAAALALVGLAWSIRRRATGPLLLLAMLAATSAYLLKRGNPYADAKVLMIVSPAILLMAALGAVSLWKGRLWPLGAVLGAVLAALVLYSNALAYRDVSHAPYDRYSELLELNDDLAGAGPVLLNEYDEFAKYFLRDVPVHSQPEWPHGYREGALTDPRRRPSLKTPLDVDDLTLEYLQSVPYIVVRRSPIASRPPANFERVRRGEFYDLWRRGPRPRVVAHLPGAAAVLRAPPRIDSATARDWGRRAQRLGGRIAVVERARAPKVFPARVENSWRDYPYPLYPGALVPAVPGRAEGPVRVPRTATYRAWIEGSFARRLALTVDGRLVGHTPRDLNNPGAYAPLGIVRLTRGTHTVVVSQGRGQRRYPGNRGYLSSLRHVGPIVFNPVVNEPLEVRDLAPRDWRELIGLRADWLEIVR